jgi:DNA-binding MarR family transcriptional regulator
MTFEGGCYCGQVRYVAEGEPRLKAQCHCRECQYISGGAPNMFMLMAPKGSRYVSGAPKSVTRSDLAQPVMREFCENCGTHLTTRRPDLPLVILKVGTLDDPEPFWLASDGDLHARQAALPCDPGRRAGVRARAAALTKRGFLAALVGGQGKQSALLRSALPTREKTPYSCGVQLYGRSMRTTFAALEPEIALIRDASRRLVRELGFMRPTLAGTDLPPSAVHALIEIGTRKSMTATELCDALILEKSSVSRMVRKLVRAGEVAEGASSQDGRAKPLSLTPQGLASLNRIDDFARRQVAEALEWMGPETRRGLAESLASYARALQACRSGKPDSPPRPRDG